MSTEKKVNGINNAHIFAFDSMVRKCGRVTGHTFVHTASSEVPCHRHGLSYEEWKGLKGEF